MGSEDFEIRVFSEDEIITGENDSSKNGGINVWILPPKYQCSNMNMCSRLIRTLPQNVTRIDLVLLHISPERRLVHPHVYSQPPHGPQVSVDLILQTLHQCLRIPCLSFCPAAKTLCHLAVCGYFCGKPSMVKPFLMSLIEDLN